jgi:ubiquinone/menaquinone biosynthesis C-methylase UbiE
VAEIVSPMFSSEATRDRIGETQQVFRSIGLKAGMRVADIGAGAGYYVVRLSPVVGPSGVVYAQDIQRSYLEELRGRVERTGLKNVKLILGQADDPRLPKDGVDAALMVHMYHEISQPYATLHRLAHSIRPGGKLVIVDANRKPENHGTPPALLRCELAAVGYKQVSFRPIQGDRESYIAVFAPPRPRDLPAPSKIKPCRG